MKACPQYQQNLALLAADLLKEVERRALQSHIANCPGCRDYLFELSEICREHSQTAENAPLVEVSRDFHERLVRRIESSAAAPAHGGGSLIQTLLAGWRWRIALPVAAGIVVLLVLANPARPRVEVTSTPPARAAAPAFKVVKADSPPTLLTYRRAASKSPEALDALLARDAEQSTRPSVRITAFTRDLAMLTD